MRLRFPPAFVTACGSAALCGLLGVSPAPAAEPTTCQVIESYMKLPAADANNPKLTAAAIDAFLANPANHKPFVPPAPLGLPSIQSKVPADNPLTIAKVELGRMLYFDPRLSRDSTISCATCHDPATGWAQNTAVAAGIDGQEGNRNSPSVINRVHGRTQFLDGRAASLEEQSLGPVQNPIEMGFTIPEVLERLKKIEGYQKFFAKVFPDGLTADNMARALAAFERLIVAGDAPYDYHVAAETVQKMDPADLAEMPPAQQARLKKILADAKAHPLTESARRGKELFFGKAECSLCHSGENFTDELFYNIGVGMDKPDFDKGRVVVTKDPKDTGAFRTPGLRNLIHNAPYMHDGSQKTLMDVIKFYDKGGIKTEFLHSRIEPLNLTEQEQADLVEFLEQGLTGPMPKIVAPRLP